jgi:hypothetical protein
MAYQNTDHDDAVIIRDLIITAVARIGMYPDGVFDRLLEIARVRGASERMQSAIEELIHAARAED